MSTSLSQLPIGNKSSEDKVEEIGASVRMGCDGGTIPKRDELVKTKKKPEQKDKSAELIFRWQHCAVSQAVLQQPIVVCEMGRIYNKDSIIEELLNKVPSTTEESSAPSVIISHIKSLRDVKALNLTENPAWTGSSQNGDGYNDNNKGQWICPISGQEMNGNYRFVCLWTCGCVFSERALKEISVHECLKCQKPFTLADVIILNSAEEDEIDSLRNKMEIRRSKAKEAKKPKKGHKSNDIQSSVSESTLTLTPTDFKKPSVPVTPSSSKCKESKIKYNNSTTTEALALLGKRQSKLQKLETSDPKLAKISGTYSVAKDPKLSETYKSLFTSSDTASTQQRAHWVTYNPFYN